MSVTKEIVVLPGDGIGPEVTREAVNVLETVCKRHGYKLKTRSFDVGGASIDRYGRPLTEKALEACKEVPAVLLGAVGGDKWNEEPKDKRPEAALLGLRKELGLFANLRPITTHQSLIHSSPLKEEIVNGVDILILRELTGGIYFGRPRFIEQTSAGERGVDTLAYETHEIERIAHKAFEMATDRNRKVTSVDKSNVLDSSRLWRRTVIDSASQWPEISLSHMLVDNCAMQLIRDPKQFDVILTGNMFGDILSDAAAMITGSIGMLPSASIGEKYAMYEPVHGSAPDIAGQNKANPLAAIASIALMCRYSLDMPEAAQEIEDAIQATLQDGFRTGDIASNPSKEYLVDTSEMGSAVLKHLNPKMQPGNLL
ncbi:3-isopropylmalate dehydrogenase [Aliifodinibius salicampi]|uniref:3-isopropylmalate dehydrogenase n=1 Tax=Fodinibius salicampi TaxID=1920655 RepID=A0ABT3PZU8_9BACT|nr:3-isopropylmalate dehydrogenase [Fodinibius salicampi]MCW9713399.1 3-isopropylmalate dehydrogenase [Fodinibius salicampi]